MQPAVNRILRFIICTILRLRNFIPAFEASQKFGKYGFIHDHSVIADVSNLNTILFLGVDSKPILTRLFKKLSEVRHVRLLSLFLLLTFFLTLIHLSEAIIVIYL